MMNLKFTNFVAITILVFSSFGFAQNWNHCGQFDPDSLARVTVSGIVIVDSTMIYPMFYLDENEDGQADYHLNFGPYWYQPDDSTITRPKQGDQINVSGGLYNSMMEILPVIVVYEIDGAFWREPYDPSWNYMGGHSHNGEHHQGACNGFAFGWMHDSLNTVTLNGIALVDTTFIFQDYYLDEDDNGMPDYFLNFGPSWYKPVSGAVYPANGDQIIIVGGMLNRPNSLPMVIVYELNGLAWRDSTKIGPHFGGGWIQKNMMQPQRIHAPFDDDDWMQINPGWHGGMGHGSGMLPDRLFGQILELFPQNIPFANNENIFAGYEIAFFYPNGSNGMWQNGSCGNQMNFNNSSQFQLHYNDIQIQGFNIDENTIEVKYWDNWTNRWTSVSNADVDYLDNTVTFSGNEISNFVILTGSKYLTSIKDETTLITNNFSLKQNYPNPFNPETTISFVVPEANKVSLKIYNALGENINTIVEEHLTAGNYNYKWWAHDLPSGIYYYTLKVGSVRETKKMVLIR